MNEIELDVPSRAPRRPVQRAASRMLTGMSATLPAFPILAIGSTLVLYVSRRDGTATMSNEAVLAYAFAAAVLSWLILAMVGASLSTVERANPGVYRELMARLDALEIEHRNAAPRDGAPRFLGITGANPDSVPRESADHVSQHLRRLSDALRTRDEDRE